MNEKVIIAIVIAVAIVIVVLILRRTLRSGRLQVNQQGIDASVTADQPTARTKVDLSKATFRSENEVNVKGDSEADMRGMKAEKKNKFNIGDSPEY